MGPIRYLAKWTVLSLLVAALAGSGSALFLFSLDWATKARMDNSWLLLLLPVAGFGVGWVYHHFGERAERGNNLLIDEIHDPKTILPLRMAPLILGSTVLSHLFGASVGREGTAVQMGGALSDQLTRVFGLDREDRRILLMAGISGGFASVFGTPLAGAVFGLEVLFVGRMRYDSILPCFFSAIAADKICLLWGVRHAHYLAGPTPQAAAWTFAAVVIAGAIFGLTGRAFAEATHRLGAFMKEKIPYAPLRPLVGGTIIAGVAWFVGGERYLGLGLETIAESFSSNSLPQDFAGKFAFTVASLASGFKGGEVTPLFFIGSTLGNFLAQLLSMAPGFLAALGFTAVFAGAANTPLSSTLMAMELFGAQIGPWAAIACVVSFLFSGNGGIYRSQR